MHISAGYELRLIVLIIYIRVEQTSSWILIIEPHPPRKILRQKLKCGHCKNVWLVSVLVWSRFLKRGKMSPLNNIFFEINKFNEHWWSWMTDFVWKQLFLDGRTLTKFLILFLEKNCGPSTYSLVTALRKPYVYGGWRSSTYSPALRFTSRKSFYLSSSTIHALLRFVLITLKWSCL